MWGMMCVGNQEDARAVRPYSPAFMIWSDNGRAFARPYTERDVTRLRSFLLCIALHRVPCGHPVLAVVTPVFSGLDDARVVKCGSNKVANFGASIRWGGEASESAE